MDPISSTPQEINRTYTKPVEFTGKGGEFFSIWIVNLLLSILTLGIYSAWAKVRANQYLYGHTRLDGHSFRFLAKPLQILVGRIIAFVVFAVFMAVSSLNPVAAVILSLSMLFVAPWLITQSLKFRMRMTSYRNVRFSFSGTYGGALLHFVVLPIVGVFSLYLAFPWVLKKIDHYLMNHIHYGNQDMRLRNETGQYYVAALIAMGVAIAIIATLGVGSASYLKSGIPDAASNMSFIVVTALVYWLGISLVSALYQCRIRNHVFANLEIDRVATFRSKMETVPFTILNVTNALLILVTFGFGYPIAKIRKLRYLADATEVNIETAAAEIVDRQVQEQASFGEEAADFFDVELSLV